MNDVVLPALGIIVPILGAIAVIWLLYALGVLIRNAIIAYAITRGINQYQKAQAAKKPVNEWAWVDDAIEEFNQSLKDW